MSIRFNLCATGVVAAVALLLLQPGEVQAHPQMVGRWVSVDPANANMSYNFDPGDYIGNGVWRGTFTIFWANNPISNGCYELRMLNGTYGVLGVTDGPSRGMVGIGSIDVGTNKVLVLKGVTYRP